MFSLLTWGIVESCSSKETGVVEQDSSIHLCQFSHHVLYLPLQTSLEKSNKHITSIFKDDPQNSNSLLNDILFARNNLLLHLSSFFSLFIPFLFSLQLPLFLVFTWTHVWRMHTLSIMFSITSSDKFIPDSASVATTIRFTCKWWLTSTSACYAYVAI